MAAFRVELKNWDEARAVAAPIRYAAFLEAKDPPPGVELDEIDPQCAHWATFVLTRPRRVLRDGRRRGVGAALIQARVDEARKHGHAEVTVSAPLQAAEFYRGLGFVAGGKVVREAGMLQQKMRKSLK